MCLKSMQRNPSTTPKDRTVYKVAIKDNYNRYYAPYRGGFEYKFNEVIEAEFTTDITIDGYGLPVVEVNAGLHSLVSFGAADQLAYHLLARSKGRENYVVLECTIPEGSEEYVGTFRDRVGYASTKLIINRELKGWDLFKMKFRDRMHILSIYLTFWKKD